MTYTDFFAIYFFDPTIIQIQKTANLERQKKKIRWNKICIILTFFHSAPRCISSLRYYYIEFIRQKKKYPRFVRVYTPVNTFLIEGKEDSHQICSKLWSAQVCPFNSQVEIFIIKRVSPKQNTAVIRSDLFGKFFLF
jgi:hypothetical protein